MMMNYIIYIYIALLMFQGEVDMDAKSLWEEMVHNINKAPTWNPTLLECKVVGVTYHW